MTNGDESLLEGLYESLITRALEKRLEGLPAPGIHRGLVDEADEPEVLARHVRDVTLRALRAERSAEGRLALVNRLVENLGSQQDSLAEAGQLLAVLSQPGAGQSFGLVVDRPSTPLSDAALLTNAPGEPGVGHEIRAELASADSADVIMAFVKWYGLRLLEDRLELLRDRGAPLRVITTTYMGATERAALDRLVRDFGAQVKVQYDAQRTRLHAKAWLFRRNTGFDTAYVGSSNLSRAAMLDGVEWNVRLSAVSTPALLQKFLATFDSYWNDETFETYDPALDRDRLDDALAEASGKRVHDRITLTLSGLEVRPYSYQQEMLDQLDVERAVHDRHRNLLVAATGTGKTVVAALDYRRLAASRPALPRLLFIAHRREILQQSLRTYREVLSDANFGELYVDGHRPERWDHVFASVQSLSAYGITNVPADAYDVVVIDEFHHAQATTYHRILDHLTPRELLGLTATPERGDGLDVRSFFKGRTAAELRLWDALKADLLTPFHYFAVADGMDLTRVDWKAGAYDLAELSNLFTGNDARARIILKAVRDKVADLSTMKALGFCVSRDHARYMTRVFNEAGVASAAVLGDTPSAERDDAVNDLATGALKVVFTVDVFNEGVDVPAINTVLFLRPTESSTVFLQQLGRGLRRARDKAVLTALDFVGHHRKEFRFDQRFRAMTGSTRAALQGDVEHGFPFLPAGTQIILDRQSQRLVLENIKSQVTRRWPSLASELRAHPTDDLGTYLHDAGVELSDVVSGAGRSWARLRREAGRDVAAPGPLEEALLKRVRALCHVDDPDRAAAYLTWLADDAPRYGDADPIHQAFGRMLIFTLWPDGGGFASYDAALDALRREVAAREDLRAVIGLGLEGAERVTSRLSGDLWQRPLRVHARYTREEIVAALDYVSIDGRKANSFREGVLFAPKAGADAFLVTLEKSEAEYSPTTMYEDYAISPQLFHWESQSGTTVASRTGQRYLNHRAEGSHVLLFTRARKVSAFGTGAPYVFLGEADYVEHRGERPIAITWRLRTSMPAADFAMASVVV
ncbi:superfamily II DNA or RNA helicase [Humibacillus xanthopallidus]|uniref:Superfamily II DNA or RNA helicase n=1 Tax=Humibacillus xanthopallidus TaxID=412689 RepID=A0A543HA22_9MICO|nr:superfamily II DNA or RNA helicase [Humibacillus xanthopallidus]